MGDVLEIFLLQIAAEGSTETRANTFKRRDCVCSWVLWFTPLLGRWDHKSYFVNLLSWQPAVGLSGPSRMTEIKLRRGHLPEETLFRLQFYKDFLSRAELWEACDRDSLPLIQSVEGADKYPKHTNVLHLWNTLCFFFSVSPQIWRRHKNTSATCTPDWCWAARIQWDFRSFPLRTASCNKSKRNS